MAETMCECGRPRATPAKACVCLSASGVEDLDACGFSYRDDVKHIDDTTNTASATGTLVHAMHDSWLNGVCDVAVTPMADVDRAQNIAWRLREWWEENAPRLDWQTEVPYAISLTTGIGRELPSKGQRDYSAATPDEVPGTIDLLAFDGDAALVWDIKTTLRPEFTTEPARNKQLLTLALAVQRAHGVDEVRVGLLFANEYVTRLETATFDVLALDMFEDDLRANVASIPASEPTPGNHCRFCKARVACPAVPKAFRIRKKVA